ncbi:MAG: ATP-binding cassette domain-containing protein, partial [bacterium]
TKRFKDTVALDDVTFSIDQGEIFGLLGPNGAGKTTLMRILVGILGPDEGRIQVSSGARKRLKERIGYLPEERGLYPKMKVKEFLKFCAALKGVPHKQIDGRIEEGLVRVGLVGQEDRKIEELSKGNQQRVQLLITLIHQPDILVLDEPFTGLDPIGVDHMKRILVEETARGATILISTHRMEDAEQLCRSIALIHRGKVIQSGPLEKIKKSRGVDELLVEYEGDAESVSIIPGVVVTAVDDHCLRLRLSPDVSIPEILRELSGNLDIYGVSRVEPTLHDIFVRLIGDEENRQ